jgi:hypothetical protein
MPNDSMNLPVAPVAQEGFVVTYFLTVADQERSRFRDFNRE